LPSELLGYAARYVTERTKVNLDTETDTGCQANGNQVQYENW